MEIVATRSPACCAAVSFSQSYRPKASRPPTTFYGESVRVNTARPLSARQSRSASRAVLNTRCEIGDSLEEFLTKATPDKNLIRLLICMGEAMRTIAFKVRTASCGGTACVNSFGDEQLAVDMLANKLLFEALEYSHVCKHACSEEVPELQDMGGPVEGGFSVAFDPLDGSSIVDTNFTVGTIFGVWPGDKLTGVTGGDQAAAAMGIYGPRTTYIVALKDCPGTHEFLLLDEGKWQHVKDTTTIGEGKMFSPGNLRATFDNPEYDKLINYYVKEKYTLRYTGGMVPDVNQEESGSRTPVAPSPRTGDPAAANPNRRRQPPTPISSTSPLPERTAGRPARLSRMAAARPSPRRPRAPPCGDGTRWSGWRGAVRELLRVLPCSSVRELLRIRDLLRATASTSSSARDLLRVFPCSGRSRRPGGRSGPSGSGSCATAAGVTSTTPMATRTLHLRLRRPLAVGGRFRPPRFGSAAPATGSTPSPSPHLG